MATSCRHRTPKAETIGPQSSRASSGWRARTHRCWFTPRPAGTSGPGSPNSSPPFRTIAAIPWRRHTWLSRRANVYSHGPHKKTSSLRWQATIMAVLTREAMPVETSILTHGPAGVLERFGVRCQYRLLVTSLKSSRDDRILIGTDSGEGPRLRLWGAAGRRISLALARRASAGVRPAAS